MKKLLALTTALPALLTAPCLFAQDAEQAPETTAPAPNEEQQPESHRKMNLSVAPPGAALERKAYAHEGFYLRVNVGPGFQYASAGGSDSTDFAVGTDLLNGGSPAPGMVLGGGALGTIGFRGDAGLHYLVGPFFDAFPNNKDGWHLGALLGVSGTTQNSNVFGGGGSIWAGYDIWVAPEWSAGFLLRGTGTYMGGNGVDMGTFSMVALISVLYN